MTFSEISRKYTVLLADDLPASEELLHKAFNNDSRWEVMGVAKTSDEAVAISIESQIDLIVISTSILALTSPADRRLFKSLNPFCVILAVSDEDDHLQLRTALALGANDCLSVSQGGTDIVNEALQRVREAWHMRERAETDGTPGVEGKKGNVFLVTGAGGGSGKSLIALNMAAIIARHDGSRVALIDLDLRSAGLTRRLTAITQIDKTIEDLDPVLEELNRDHLRSIENAQQSGLSFIPGRLGGCPGSESDTGRVGKIVEVAAETYDSVIVDCSLAELGHLARVEVGGVFVVVTPYPAAVACGRMAISKVRQAGMSEIHLLVNKSDAPGHLTIAEITRLTGLDAAVTLVTDEGIGAAFERQGREFSERTDLAFVRGLIPAAQRVTPFESLEPRASVINRLIRRFA